MMLAFEIIGKSHNATRVLDIVTDDVFGQRQASYNTVRGVQFLVFVHHFLCESPAYFAALFSS